MILAAAIGVKLIILCMDVVPFNADEAVVALMAKHILRGEFPLFFYGQAYMGSLDAFLVAMGFWIFGEKIWVIRFVQIGLYLVTIYVSMFIMYQISKNWTSAYLAGLFMAIPSVNVTLYTTISLGGYGEALLIGCLLILVSFKIREKDRTLRAKTYLWLSWGLLAGVGLWANALTLVYTIPSFAYLLADWWEHKETRKIIHWGGMALFGFLLGSVPWWIYAGQHGLSGLVGEIMGSAIDVEGGGYLQGVMVHLVNFILFGSTVILGLRPPWSVEWLVMPMIPFILLLWIWIIYYFACKWHRGMYIKPEPWLILGTILCLTCGFLFTPFGIDPSGRYFLPFIVPISMILGYTIWNVPPKLWMKIGLIVFIVGFNFCGIIQSALNYPPGITTQFNAITQIDQRKIGDLATFLHEIGETRGFTNYWVAYPLAFISNEQIVFTPRLPYHLDMRYTARDNRYPPYDGMVAESNRAAYITTKHPELDERLRQAFRNQSITWQEKKIGDFQIFYQLSAYISPEQINLSGVTP